jgi:hypothetical protein
MAIRMLVLLIVLTAISQAEVLSDASLNDDTSREIITYTLNGVLEENDLDDSTSIVECFDDLWATKTVVFTKQLFEKLASTSPSGLPSL